MAIERRRTEIMRDLADGAGWLACEGIERWGEEEEEEAGIGVGGYLSSPCWASWRRNDGYGGGGCRGGRNTAACSVRTVSPSEID
jgi:hypothetical protein